MAWQFFRLLGRLPLPLLHRLGWLAGWLAWTLSPRFRRLARGHAAQAGIGATDLRRSIGETGKGGLELPFLWTRSPDDIAARIVQVSGWEAVEQAHRRGSGILFMTPHLGCFEITAQHYARHAPITVLFRPPRKAWLRPLVEHGRGSKLQLAPADLSGVRQLMRALRRNEAVGMLPDQVPGQGEGLWSPFFGRAAYTMTLAARLTETGASVLFCYAERLPAGRGYHVHYLEPPLPIEGDLAQRVAAINACLESLIRLHPDQYLWGYNRYKRPAGAEPPPAR